MKRVFKILEIERPTCSQEPVVEFLQYILMQGIICLWAYSDSSLLPFGRADYTGWRLASVIAVFNALVLWTSGAN